MLTIEFAVIVHVIGGAFLHQQVSNFVEAFSQLIQLGEH
jgi:DNA-binding transcriptional regulator of glucitol operon